MTILDQDAWAKARTDHDIDIIRTVEEIGRALEKDIKVRCRQVKETLPDYLKAYGLSMDDVVIDLLREHWSYGARIPETKNVTPTPSKHLQTSDHYEEEEIDDDGIWSNFIPFTID